MLVDEVFVTDETRLARMHRIPGAPTGFENVNPVADGLVEVRQPGSTEADSVFSIVYQVNAVGIDELENRRDITFGGVSMSPRSDGSGFDVVLSDGVVAPGIGAVLQAIEVTQDFRGFTSQVPQGQLGSIFTDGFESGNTSAWTLVNP